MRLIDADALLQKIQDHHCADCESVKADRNGVACAACQWDDATMMLEEAPTVMGWISVEDRLPEIADDVLIWYEWTGRSGAKYGEIMLTSVGGIKLLGYTPLYWMPLPEPPKEVQDG